MNTMIKPSPNIEYHLLPHVFFQEMVPAGHRLVVLGESEKGEFYNPVLISRKEHAEEYFGSGPLISCLEDILTYSKVRVYLMRIEPGRFDRAFRYLEIFPFDFLYCDGIFFNTNTQVVESFLEFAQIKEYIGQPVHGIFELNHRQMFDDLAQIGKQIGRLHQITENGEVDLGRYISVVADQIEGKKAGCVYAGLLMALNPEISPMNKTLSVELKYEFTNEEIRELHRLGIVHFKRTLKKGIVAATSTCAVQTKNSPYKHVENIRILQAIISKMAEGLDQYIGTRGVRLQRSRIEEVIEDILNEEIKNGRITDFVYEMDDDPIEGVIYIHLSIVPIFTVYYLSASTQVRVRM